MKHNRKYPIYYTTKYKAQIMGNVIEELVRHCLKTNNKKERMSLIHTQVILDNYLELIEKKHNKIQNSQRPSS